VDNVALVLAFNNCRQFRLVNRHSAIALYSYIIAR
jgi:hypothetical protein